MACDGTMPPGLRWRAEVVVFRRPSRARSCGLMSIPICREVRLTRTLGKSDRITRRKEISRVFEQGRSCSDGLLRVHVLGNSFERSRLCVAVSSRLGVAARRNRAKRLCREAFRACRDELPVGYDYVLVPLAGRELSVEAVRRSLLALVARLIKEPQR